MELKRVGFVAALIGAVFLYAVAAIPWWSGLSDVQQKQQFNQFNQNETQKSSVDPSPHPSQQNSQDSEIETGYIPYGYYGGHRCPMMGYW